MPSPCTLEVVRPYCPQMLSHRFHVRAIRSNGCCRLECQRDVHFHKYLCIYNFFQLRINPQRERERERERERRELREKLRIHQGCLLQILRELLIFLIYSLRTARRKIWNVIFFFLFFCAQCISCLCGYAL